VEIGNTEVGSRAAISHSARMTSGYGLYRAAFKQSGVVEIREVDELVDIAKAFHPQAPAGNRVGFSRRRAVPAFPRGPLHRARPRIAAAV
jgi:acyl-CoA synthetase (NDP forming)